MKLSEKQKKKICDYMEQSLNNVKLQHLLIDDDSRDHLPLVDLLSVGSKDIKDGKEEISNIVQQIYFDMDDWDV